MTVRFTQSCPTCGRRIEVRASLMGCDVGCQHCHAVFVAHRDDVPHEATHQPFHSQATDEFSSDPLMDRVQQALNRAEESTVVG
ncbi:MAG: response regulator [Rubripirellula sp.]|nr:response regulator [Rhodopirellula sp.]MCH1438203.1 response regulator [Rubripirellula sp.]